MATKRDWLTISETAARSGLTPSTLRYYEELGLIEAERTAGGQRRFARPTLRRLAFIRAAQRIGLSLDEVAAAFARLPEGRAPNVTEWNAVARAWERRIDEQIAKLELLRRNLRGCIGCGCLSLRRCALYNNDDIAAEHGPGAHYLLRTERLTAD
jgi:MerR family redox-sensitive transcriptional activator SoxR